MTGTTRSDRAREALGMDKQRSAGQELSPVEQRINERIVYVRSLAPAFRDAVAQGLTPETLVRDAITALRNNPNLATTVPETFAGALMTAGQLGLRPNVGSLGHGWVVPFKNSRTQRFEAQWILGYQGMVELGYRSGLVQKITADTIYEGERHRVLRGTDDRLEHEPLADPSQRGAALWHYACVWLNTGGVVWNAIPDADAQRVRDTYSQQGTRGLGPWAAEYEQMARKTALRGLWRFMPKTPVLAMALQLDGVVRAGTDRDAAVLNDQDQAEHAADREAPVRGSVQVNTPQPPPEPEPPAEPVAEQVPEPEDDEPAGPFQCSDGSEREPIKPTQARTAYIERITSAHPNRVDATVEQVVGEAVPLAYLTTAELRDVAAFRWGDE